MTPMSQHAEEYEQTPRWRLLMYPAAGFITVLAAFGAWLAFG